MEGWGEEEDTGAAAFVEAGLSATGCSDFEQAARSRKPASTSGIEVFFTDSSKDFGARAARIIPLAQEAKFRDEASVGMFRQPGWHRQVRDRFATCTRCDRAANMQRRKLP